MAGNNKFQAIYSSCLKDANALCLVVDLHKWGTFTDAALKKDKEYLIALIKQLREANPNINIPIYLIGTKQDLVIEKEAQGNPGIMSVAIERLVKFANKEIILDKETVKIPASRIMITSAVVNPAITHTSDNVTPKALTPLAIFQQVYQDLREANPAVNNDNTSNEVANDVKPKPFFEKFPDLGPSGPSADSRFFGAIVGILTGAFFGFIIHNPGTCLLAALRESDWKEWGIANLLRAYLFAPLINPFVAAFYGAKDGGIAGAEYGITKVLDIPAELTTPFKERTIIAGTLLSVFIAAVLLTAFPILPIAFPTLVGIAGLAAFVGVIACEGYNIFKSGNLDNSPTLPGFLIATAWLTAAAVFLGAPFFPLALPLMLGIAGAVALVGVISYESFDFFQTTSESQTVVKDNTSAKPTLLPIRQLDPTSKATPKQNILQENKAPNAKFVQNQNVNAHTGSMRSWFQVSQQRLDRAPEHFNPSADSTYLPLHH